VVPSTWQKPAQGGPIPVAGDTLVLGTMDAQRIGPSTAYLMPTSDPETFESVGGGTLPTAW
jgi:hypothetical protein